MPKGFRAPIRLVNPSAFFVLYQKSAVELVTQEAAIWVAITNIENASKRR